jgi:hypothetical protein
MTVYVKYDRCKPHLPIAIADTKEELAKMVGMSLNTVRSSLSHGIGSFAEVEIGELELYPDNDGRLWYYNEQGRVAYVD